MNRHGQSRRLTVLLGVLLSACGGSGGSDAGAPKDEALPPFTPLPANPLAITVTLDATHAASVEVGPEGGAVTATGADGTLYALSLPAGALLSPEIIQVTPLSGVAGLPFSGGVLGGAQLEPSGLRLRALATLTVTPPVSFAAATAVGFGYEWDGADARPIASFPAGSAISIPIAHFSGAGVGVASAADMTDLQGRMPLDSWAQCEAQAGLAIARAQVAGQPFPLPALEAIFTSCFDRVIYPKLRQAETDDRQLDAADADFQAWIVTQARFGCDLQAQSDRGMISLKRGFANGMKQSAARCHANKDVGEASHILSLGQRAYLLGFDMSSVGRGTLSHCVRFDVKVRSNMLYDEPGGWLVGEERAGTVPVRVRWVGASIDGPSGTGELTLGTYDWWGRHIADSGGNGHPWTIIGSEPVHVDIIVLPALNSRRPSPGSDAPPRPRPPRMIFHLIDDGQVRLGDPIAPEAWIQPGPPWGYEYAILHRSELDATSTVREPNRIFVMSGLEDGGADLCGVKRYVQSELTVFGATLDEDTLFEVWHRPIAPAT